MLERYLLEIRGKSRRGESPRTGEIRRGEPPSGDEIVDRSPFPHAEDIAFRIGHPEKLGALHLFVLRLALKQDQLRRFETHEDFWSALSIDCLSRKRCLDLFPVLLVGKLREAFGKVTRGRPRPLDVRCLQ